VSTAQAGIVYRYFRVDADHDVSADPLKLSLDRTTWITSGIDYVAPVDYPPSVIAANTTRPPRSGLTGYWWRALTGPAQTLPLTLGRNIVFGDLTDTPEEPRLAWGVTVTYYE
jgi:hypothetical protein